MTISSGAITDVGGIMVGHHHRLDDSGWATGSTVVLTPPGTVAAVEVRGGAPGTRETDLLDPANTVRYVDAILLTGGSAYGLAAADGVMRWLEERASRDRHGRRCRRAGGARSCRPQSSTTYGRRLEPSSAAEFGYAAAQTAGRDVAVGSVGAGTGARAGVLKGGVGTASTVLSSGVTVGALVVVNCVGDVIDPATGLPWTNYLTAELGLSFRRRLRSLRSPL